MQKQAFLEKLLKADMPNSIGSTQSGKPVFSQNSDKYSEGFNSQDHLDAQKLHEQKAASYEKRSKSSMLRPGAKFDHKAIMTNADQASKHRELAEYHQSMVNEDKSNEQNRKLNEKLQAEEATKMQKSKKAKFKQQLEGGLADKKSPKDFDPKALAEGQKVEMEHTNDPNKAEEIAMDHLTEDEEYYKKLKTIEKSSFVDKLLDLIKGGPGSGKKGHLTPRKPYPGEERHKLGPLPAQQPTHMPTGGLMPHYSDTKELSNYKKLLRMMEKEGMDYKGHVTFEPETGKIKLLTPKGEQNFKDLQAKYQKKTPAKTTP